MKDEKLKNYCEMKTFRNITRKKPTKDNHLEKTVIVESELLNMVKDWIDGLNEISLNSRNEKEMRKQIKIMFGTDYFDGIEPKRVSSEAWAIATGLSFIFEFEIPNVLISPLKGKSNFDLNINKFISGN